MFPTRSLARRPVLAATAKHRPSRPAPLCEALEDRKLFDAVFPTANEQYVVQLINRLRADPAAEIARVVALGRWTGAQDLNEGVAPGTFPAGPRQPMAINPFVTDAARKHSQFTIDNPNNSPNPHFQVINGVQIGPTERVTAAGYKFRAQGGVGENIWTTFNGTDNLDDLLRLVQEPLNDYNATGGVPGRGHRAGLLNGGNNEIGAGIALGTSGTFTFTRVTQDFTNAGNGSFLLGVAINDLNNDQFYQPGEGLGGITITATRTTDNQVFTTTTWDAGGYSLKLDPGNYNVVATGGTIGAPAPKNVTITTENVAADFIQANATPAAPNIVTQPQNTTPNRSATTFSFSVAATGTPVPTVQWQVAPFGTTTFTDIPGATAYTYTGTVAPTLNGNQYRAVLTNSQGTATSNAASLFVQGGTRLPITVTTSPNDQTVNVGDTVTFTAAATGFTSFKWQVMTPARVFSDIPGATNQTLTFVATADLNGNTYYASYSNPTGGQSLPATLTVNAAPVAPAIVVQPQAPVTTVGGNAVIPVVTTAFPAPTVTLQTQDPAGDWADFDPAVGDAAPRVLRPAVATLDTSTSPTGLTTFTFPVTAADNKKHFRVVVTNGEGSVTTSVIKLSVNTKSAVTNDRASLNSAIKQALASVETCRKATAAQIKILSKDLKRLKASKEARTALNVLARNEKASRVAFLKNEKALFGQISRLAREIDRDSQRLVKRPSDAAALARLQANLTAIQTAADGSTAAPDASACKLSQTDALDALSALVEDDAGFRLHLFNAGQNANNIAQVLRAPVDVAQLIVTRLVSTAQA